MIRRCEGEALPVAFLNAARAATTEAATTEAAAIGGHQNALTGSVTSATLVAYQPSGFNHFPEPMDAAYLICLLVGGFFVLLSLLGGGDTEADVDADFDADADAGGDFDGSGGADADALEAVSDVSAGPGLVDLFTIRALFLFMAFFGLTGVLLGWVGTEEPTAAVLAALTGLVVGLGGNYVIKSVGYRHVSSSVTSRDLKGTTAEVLLPFEGDGLGKVTLVARGHRMHLRARSFEAAGDVFAPGDEVVVVRMDGSVAEVVKPE